jgi:hypothetical protein
VKQAGRPPLIRSEEATHVSNYFRIDRGPAAIYVFFEDATVENVRAAWADILRIAGPNPFPMIGVWRQLPYEGAWQRRATVISGESMRFANGVNRSALGPTVS